MQKVVLAIDQGTTNTKALLIDGGGRIVSRAAASVPIEFPQPGWVQQDPNAIWRSVMAAVSHCCAGASRAEIIAIGISNQRESILLWDRNTGEPLGPCITWQCRRTSSFCDELRERGLSDFLVKKTGLAIDPLFSASKAVWLLDNVPDARAKAKAGDACLGTVDSWLIWRLTGGKVHATDPSNASRTQLVDLERACWDDELLRVFDVPREALPQIRRSSGVFGETVACAELSAGIPIAAVAGDSHAAMFGHGIFYNGMVKATFGTGTSLMTIGGAGRNVSDLGLSRTIAWQLGSYTTLAVEGNIASTGGTKEWLGRLLGVDAGDGFSALAAPDAAGVYIVPAFSGLGAPYWDDRARGLVCGLTAGAGSPELVRATLEAIAYQVRDVFDAMRNVAPLTSLLADGGASRDDTLMQFQADMIACPVIRNRSTDVSALGAAWLAGLAVELWRDIGELERLPRSVDRYEPTMPEVRREQLYAGWRDAVARARLRMDAPT